MKSCLFCEKLVNENSENSLTTNEKPGKTIGKKAICEDCVVQLKEAINSSSTSENRKAMF